MTGGTRRRTSDGPLLQVLGEADVAADGLHVEVLAAEVLLRVLVRAAEIVVQALRGGHEEARRLADEVLGGGEDGHLSRAGHAPRDAAIDEFRIEPVVAFLEVAAVGHLGNDVRGTQQAAQQAKRRLRQADRRDGALVAGEVQDRRRHGRELAHPDRRQVLAQETAAARDVRARVFRAAAVPAVAAAAQVAHVVEERADDAQREEPLADGRRVDAGALVAVEEPGHGERYLQDVLQVVVGGVALPVGGILAAVERGRVVEGLEECGGWGLRVEAAVDPADFELHADRVRGVDPVADVEFVAAVFHRAPPRCATCCFFCLGHSGNRSILRRIARLPQGPVAACQD